MTRSVGLHLISKLRYNSALYFEWPGVYSGRGPRPKYGQRVSYQDLALVDYYRLRFQIEFNFRDAKQHWGAGGFYGH